MDIFLKRMTPPEEGPQAGHSGGILEKGIVVIREDSSMPVTVPEDLPVGQDVEVEV